MKIGLETLILLTFSRPGSLKPLFLRHEEHPGRRFCSIYSPFRPILQPKIRLSSRNRSNQSG